MLVHSAGATLFTVVDGEIRWALVREKSGNYGLPKGQVEPGKPQLRPRCGRSGRRLAFVPGSTGMFRRWRMYTVWRMAAPRR